MRASFSRLAADILMWVDCSFITIIWQLALQHWQNPLVFAALPHIECTEIMVRYNGILWMDKRFQAALFAVICSKLSDKY